MRILRCSILILLIAGIAAAQKPGPAAGAKSRKAPVAGPSTGVPAKRVSSFDATALDKATDPCVDFYQFSCGGWLSKNPVPADQAAWGRFSELAERNLAVLHEILERASRASSRKPGQQKIGDYYAACMNEDTIQRAGVGVLKSEFDQINAIRNTGDLAFIIGHLHQNGVSALFQLTSETDFKNTGQVIAKADQGGLSLPDRDYYLKTDARSVETQKAFVEHLAAMFKLLGDAPEQAQAEAQAVMTIETALARGSMEITLRREPANVYHKLTVKDWQALNPGFSIKKYFSILGQPNIASLNVANPDFFKAMDALLKTASLDDLKTYLRWQVLHKEAAFLPAVVVNEDFNFFGRALTGQQELSPRWKRCVAAVDQDLGEALGQAYVEKNFPPEARARTLKMVKALEAALGRDIKMLPWMSTTTKMQALIKLQAIENKIGYPDKWRDYSSLTVFSDDAFGNNMRASHFEFRRLLAKIGKPPDKKEWDMTPPTVNANYNPTDNNINFPAGILQPPFFDFKADDGLNFGGIGAVIGHELTHGFDDQGRQFDAAGNLRDWWTAADNKAFNERAQCLVDEYSSFTASGDVKLNGKLTLGENTADNGGLRIADMALLATLSEVQMKQKIDGFTPEQRLFLGWGQVWCMNMADAMARRQALTNPHSLPKFRVNGVVRNMPEFSKAWGCKTGQPMAPENACHVW